MIEIFKLLREFWSKFKLLGARHYAVALVICLGVARLRYDHPSLWKNAVLAIFLDPVLWGALVLGSQLYLYYFRARRVASGKDPSPSAAYRQLSRINSLHDGLSHFTLGYSVPLAHLLLIMYMNTNSSGVEVNFEATASGEGRRQAVIVNRSFLMDICKFAALASSEEGERSKQLEAAVADAEKYLSSSFARDVVMATSKDGPGIESTLAGLLRLHFVAVLPTADRSRIARTFRLLPVDPELYGWLGGRVVQLTIETALGASRDDTQALRDLCAEITTMLKENVNDPEGLLAAKSEARVKLMARIRSTLD